MENISLGELERAFTRETYRDLKECLSISKTVNELYKSGGLTLLEACIIYICQNESDNSDKKEILKQMLLTEASGFTYERLDKSGLAETFTYVEGIEKDSFSLRLYKTYKSLPYEEQRRACFWITKIIIDTLDSDNIY